MRSVTVHEASCVLRRPALSEAVLADGLSEDGAVAGLFLKAPSGMKHWQQPMSADMQLRGGPCSLKRHDSAYASVCTASKHVPFFWVAKVTLGLEEKLPTCCLQS